MSVPKRLPREILKLFTQIAQFKLFILALKSRAWKIKQPLMHTYWRSNNTIFSDKACLFIFVLLFLNKVRTMKMMIYLSAFAPPTRSLLFSFLSFQRWNFGPAAFLLREHNKNARSAKEMRSALVVSLRQVQVPLRGVSPHPETWCAARALALEIFPSPYILFLPPSIHPSILPSVRASLSARSVFFPKRPKRHLECASRNYVCNLKERPPEMKYRFRFARTRPNSFLFQSELTATCSH